MEGKYLSLSGRDDAQEETVLFSQTLTNAMEADRGGLEPEVYNIDIADKSGEENINRRDHNGVLT